MPKDLPDQKMKRKRVQFTLEAPTAREVFVAGDFNDWNLGKHPLKKVENGMWNKTVILPAGTYEYKFYIDGRWQLDPQNEVVSRNCFGSHNNVLDL